MKMIPDYQYTFQIRMEHPIDIIEDDPYTVRYFIKNKSGKPFPGGGINLRVKYPFWGDTFSVIHEWRLPSINDEVEYPLEPKPIKAVAGPNVFIFLEIYSGLSGQKILDVKLVDIEGNRVLYGTLIGYLRVVSHEELIAHAQQRTSGISLQIAAFSLVILIIAQIFDWVFQMWLSDKTCIQNMMYSGMILFSILILLVSLGYSKLR